jgi:hypothetical protein
MRREHQPNAERLLGRCLDSDPIVDAIRADLRRIFEMLMEIYVKLDASS